MRPWLDVSWGVKANHIPSHGPCYQFKLYQRSLLFSLRVVATHTAAICMDAVPLGVVEWLVSIRDA
jgi:hypothetical protein